MSATRELRLGTRGSQLALWQANTVAARHRRSTAARRAGIVVIKTSGDRLQEAPLSEIGGKRLFVKEIEDALLARRDRPGRAQQQGHAGDPARRARRSPRCCRARIRATRSCCRRARPGSAAISDRSTSSSRAARPDAAASAPSSVRRVAQLRAAASRARASCRSAAISTPGCASSTRASYDALVLAAAGLRRLGFASRISFDAAGGRLRAGAGPGHHRDRDPRRRRRACARAVAPIDDALAGAALDAERAVVEALGGGCQTPIGALAVPIATDELELIAVVVVARRQPRRPRRARAARATDAGAIGARRRPSSCWPRAPATSSPRRSAIAGCGRRHCSRDAVQHRLSDRRRPRRSRADHRARPASASRAADVVLYDHLVHPRLLQTCAAGRREDRRRHRGAAAARAGSDLLPARREGARGQDRRAAEVGRPVRLRSRRRGSAVPARAGRAVRSRARRSGRHRRAGLRRRPAHLSRRRRHADVRARPRGRRQDARRRSTGPAWRGSTARSSATPGRSSCRRCSSALLAHGRPADDPAALIYNGTLPTQETIVGTLDELAAAVQAIDRPARRRSWSSAASSALREHLRWFDARPLFGKRVLVTRPREQAAELVELLEALGAEAIEAPMIRIVPPEDYGPLDEACATRRHVRLDRVHERQRGRRVHAAAARPRRATCARSRACKLCAVGPATAERLARYGLKVDLDAGRVPRRGGRAARSPSAATLAGLDVLLPRADIGREVDRRGAARAGRRRHRGRRLPHRRRRAGARGRARHLPDAARAAHRRRDVHERVGGPQLRAACSAPSRPPTCCGTTVVASIGPVTAEAAAQYDIQTTIMPAHYTIPALVDAIVEHFETASR